MYYFFLGQTKRKMYHINWDKRSTCQLLEFHFNVYSDMIKELINYRIIYKIITSNHPVTCDPNHAYIIFVWLYDF